MATNSPNYCIRCGKVRVVTKTWQEGNITYSTSVCPDTSCQSLIDDGLKKKQEHLTMLREQAEKRRKDKQFASKKRTASA